MACDHDVITDVTLSNKYVIVYCGDTFIMGGPVTGEATTAHTLETFDTIQALVNRGEALGFECCAEYLISAMELGAALSPELMTYLHSIVWSGDIGHQMRMIALGQSEPV